MPDANASRSGREPPASSRRGFRFSIADGLFLAVAGIATTSLWPIIERHALLVPFVAGHFFLFCNVVRLRQSYELLWACVFVLNYGAWLFSDALNWWGPFLWWGVTAVQVPITVLLVAIQIRSKDYHGIFCRRERETPPGP